MRGRKRKNGSGVVVPTRRTRSKAVDYEMIHNMEAEAYHAVLKAFSAQSDTLSWDRVALMTKLRKELNVTDEEHGELLVEIRRADESIRVLREWRNTNGVGPVPDRGLGDVETMRSDTIRIGGTERLVEEVEKMLEDKESLSPAQLERAKLSLQERERGILEALDMLAAHDEAAGP